MRKLRFRRLARCMGIKASTSQGQQHAPNICDGRRLSGDRPSNTQNTYSLECSNDIKLRDEDVSLVVYPQGRIGAGLTVNAEVAPMVRNWDRLIMLATAADANNANHTFGVIDSACR